MCTALALFTCAQCGQCGHVLAVWTCVRFNSVDDGVGCRILANRDMTRFLVEYHGAGDSALPYAHGNDDALELGDNYDFLRGLNMVVGSFDYHGIVREVFYWGSGFSSIGFGGFLVECALVGLFGTLSPGMLSSGSLLPLRVAWEDFIMEEPRLRYMWSTLQSVAMVDFDSGNESFIVHDTLPMDFVGVWQDYILRSPWVHWVKPRMSIW